MTADGRSDYLLGVGEAVGRILAEMRPLGPERVALLDAQGRVLAGDVSSPVALPPWDNSAMDGYAVRAADIAGASAGSPRLLRVIETVAAGGTPARRVSPGEATRIMTGAPLPAGADSVVRVEDTDGGLQRVLVHDARDAGRNVRPRGEDVAEGQVVIVAGTALGAAQLGVLASVGAAHVDVVRRPSVAILASGDELVDLDRFDDVRAGRKIVSSNSYTLRALVRDAGGDPTCLGIAADTPQSLRDHLDRARGFDLVITSGGISVGAFDHVREVLASMGADMKFWRVRMRPGAPLGFGLLGATPWIGLPGNPVSTMVTGELFARPAIRKMAGHTLLFRRPVPVELGEPVAIHAALTHFLRTVVTVRPDGRRVARLTGPQGSGLLTSLAHANALLVVPPDRLHVAAGEQLNAIPYGADAELSGEFTL